MANVKFSRKDFEAVIKLTSEIQEKISLFGTPLETINDQEIELEILANRPDLLSLHGFLRAFKGFLGKETGLKEYKVNKSGYKLIVEKSLPKEWPYAIACIVKGINFTDSKIKEVIDIQEKLGATILRKRKKGGIGLYPLQKINFPVTFKGMKPEEIKFRPLEYPEVINGRQILSKHPTGREYADLVTNWDKFPVFVDDKGAIMSMPPIINSHDMGKIDEKTTDVFIEATGTDLRILKAVLNILVTALSDMGGKIYSISCIQQDKKVEELPNLTPEKMKVSLKNTNKLLGLELTERQLKTCLEKMGHNYKNNEVEIPAWRTDILHEHDLIEDVVIAYGYENLTPTIPNISSVGQENPLEIKKRRLSEILVGLNMLETSSFHLTTLTDQVKNVSGDKENLIEISDSKTEYNLLRKDLLSCLLKTLSENSDSEYPQRIFELGRVFDKDKKSDTAIIEKEHLSITIADQKTNFTEIKQAFDYLMKMLEKEYEIKTASNHFFVEGRCGAIIVDNKEIGFIGEISPGILSTLKIKMPIAALELDIEEVLNK